VTYGFGATATLPPKAIASLAATCEELGYDSLWLNVAGALQGTRSPARGVPEGTPEWRAIGVQHPADMLGAALDATTRLTVGIGLAPIDVFPAAELVAVCRRRSWPAGRGILGLAAGASGIRCGSRMRDALETMRAAGLPLALGSGGRGPRVLGLSGELADAVCLAWLTPSALAAALEPVRRGATTAGRPMPPVYAYVRLGVGEGGEGRLRAEMVRYGKLPHHGNDREAFGFAALIGAVLDSPADLPAALAPYRGARIVIRPVLASPGDLGAWETAARDLAPAKDAPSAA
jgi:hypothetical protein